MKKFRHLKYISIWLILKEGGGGLGKPPTTLNLKDPCLLLDRTSRRVFCISVPRFLCLLHYGDYSSEWIPLEYLLCVVKEVHVCNACLIKTSTIWYPWERGERGGMRHV